MLLSILKVQNVNPTAFLPEYILSKSVFAIVFKSPYTFDTHFLKVA